MKHTLFLLFFCLPIFAREPIPVVVIGSGPAGMSAALVTGRERVETHIYLGDRAGGPLNAITCLSNWPGSVKGKGHKVMERLFAQLERYSVNQHEEAIVDVDFSSWPYRLTTSSGATLEAKTVIIATGAVPRKLDVPGEGDLPTHHFVYKTDKDRFSGQTVAVVGGGIDASKKARILSKSAKKVYLIVRKDKMQLPYMEKQKKNVEILFNTEVKAIESGALILSDGVSLEVDSLVLAMGIEPNTALFDGQLALNEREKRVLFSLSSKNTSPMSV